MDDLIERLKAATEGSAKLDLEIAEMVGWQDGQCPRRLYSRSLDAAVTLVPLNDLWQVRGFRRFAAAAVGFQGEEHHYTAPTPALALCIAALMARRSEL